MGGYDDAASDDALEPLAAALAEAAPTESAKDTGGASAKRAERAATFALAFGELLRVLDAVEDGRPNEVLALVHGEAERAERDATPEATEWAQFLRSSAHLIARGRAAGVMQLALLEPAASAVRTAAEGQIARGLWRKPLFRLLTPRKRTTQMGCLRTLEGHQQAAVAVVAHPDGKRLISGGVDDAVRVWDVATGTCLQRLPGHNQGVTSLVLHPDGRRLLVAGGDGTVRAWDLANTQCLFVRAGHLGRIESLVLHPDGRRMITAGRDRYIRVWSLDDGACIGTFGGHANVVNAIAIHPDGRRIISASDDHTLRVWNLDAAQSEAEREARADAVVWVGFTRDGRQALSVSFSGAVRVWNADTGECTHTIETGMKHVRGGALRADNRRLVLLGRDGSLVEWHIGTGACLGGSDGTRVQSAQISPDGSFVLLYPGDGTIRAWGVDEARVVSIVETTGVTAALPLPRGRMVVAFKDRTFNVQHIESGVIEQWIRLEEDFDTTGRLLTDGLHLVSIRRDCTVQFLNLETGKLRRTLQPHDAKVTAVGLSSDTGFLTTASRDKSLRAWDLATGAMLARWDSDVPATAAAVGAENHVAMGDALGGVHLLRCTAVRNSVRPDAISGGAAQGASGNGSVGRV
jgi:WD40 repeat protein